MIDHNKIREIMSKCMDLIPNIWQSDPFNHPLSQLVPGYPSVAEASATTLDRQLREVLQAVHSTPGIELTTWLRTTSSVKGHLPTWQPLLFATQEALTLSLGSEKANSLLRGLNSEKSGIIQKNTRT